VTTDEDDYTWFAARSLNRVVKTPARFGSVRLVIVRGRGKWSMANVVVRVQEGFRQRDIRVMSAPVLTEPGSAASADPLVCLEEAVRSLREFQAPSAR